MREAPSLSLSLAVCKSVSVCVSVYFSGKVLKLQIRINFQCQPVNEHVAIDIGDLAQTGEFAISTTIFGSYC